MAVKDLPKYKDIRGSIRRSGRYPFVGTAVKDTHVIHHSLTLQHLAGSNPNSFANTHIDTNGWHGCAYHFVIMPDGTIYQTDDLDRRTYHAGNTNTRSIGTCVVGDFRKGKERPTQAQMESLYLLNKELFKELPNMKYAKGHQECPGYAWKNCPGDNWDYRRVINGELVTSDDGGVSPNKPAPLPNQYTIQEGDTFWSVSKEISGLSVNQLIAANIGVDPKKLRVGQVINLNVAVTRPSQAPKPKPKPNPKPSTRKIVLPKTDSTWTVYKLGRPCVKSNPANIAGVLKPAKFGGLTYTILKDKGNGIYEIQTGDFGRVQIYAAPSTGAKII